MSATQIESDGCNVTWVCDECGHHGGVTHGDCVDWSDGAGIIQSNCEHVPKTQLPTREEYEAIARDLIAEAAHIELPPKMPS